VRAVVSCVGRLVVVVGGRVLQVEMVVELIAVLAVKQVREVGAELQLA